MMKKFASIITVVAISAFFAFAGCQQGGGQKGQAPEKTAPTTSPTTTTAPSSPGAK